MTNKTTVATPKDIERQWFVIDASGVPVGRLASQVARVLRGKHKPTFTYHEDCGDFVVVVNAEKAVWTGNKRDELVHWHTGWPGGLRNISRGRMLDEKPVKSIEKAVWGMLPKNALGRRTYKKLKVYPGPDHPHAAQNPQEMPVHGGRK